MLQPVTFDLRLTTTSLPWLYGFGIRFESRRPVAFGFAISRDLGLHACAITMKGRQQFLALLRVVASQTVCRRAAWLGLATAPSQTCFSAY